MKATGKTFTELYFMIDKKGIRETGNSGRFLPAFSVEAIGITRSKGLPSFRSLL